MKYSTTEHITIADELIKQIGKIADEHEYHAYVVGGYVRDVLLGKDGKDTDIVVIGDGIEFAKLVAKYFHKRKVVTYEKFGTAMLNLGSDGREERKIEFVTARKERYARTSRKPIVSHGTLENDLSRRDFTINAIAASINSEQYGEIVDPFDGRKDLERRIIRTPLEPEKTFDDDPLRMMRAIRFASQLGFTIESKTFAMIAKMRERLRIVSQERITDEFIKILMSSKPSVGLKLMYDAGIMHLVFPEIAEMAGVEQRDDYHHKDVFLHTLQVVDNISGMTENLWLRFTALVHDIAKPSTKAFREGVGWTFYGHDEVGMRMLKGIFQRMRLPMEYLKYVEKLVCLHLRPMALVNETVTDSAVRRLLFEAGEDVDDLMMLCRADITSKNPELVKQYSRNYEIVMRKMKEVEEKDRLRAFQPPVRGDEIMHLFGLKPGPAVGKLKKMVEEAILEGEISNEHDAAVEFLMKVKDKVLEEKK